MRTAVIRVDVDPNNELPDAVLRQRQAALAAEVTGSGMELVDSPGRREMQFLMAGNDVHALRKTAVELCERVFGTKPSTGVVTYVSRGTDDDALGVLAGFGLTGEVSRRPGADGYDVVSVRLPKAGLDRVPESRIQTALEATLNESVVIELFSTGDR